MALVGNVYIQATDPGAVGFGYWWVNSTTGAAYSRNVTNTSWVPQGNWNYTNSGNMPLTGGIMTGNITGVTGWAPINSPNFTGSPQKLSVDLATVNDLSDLDSELRSLINSLVSSAVASMASSISISNNICFLQGNLTGNSGNSYQVTVPLPSFPDATATEDQCYWAIWPSYADNDAGGVAISLIDVSPVSGRNYHARVATNDNISHDLVCGYLIIGVR